jgi:hypothetical protein
LSRAKTFLILIDCTLFYGTECVYTRWRKTIAPELVLLVYVEDYTGDAVYVRVQDVDSVRRRTL